jgi:hypothetical protein
MVALIAPFRALMWIFREVAEQAEHELNGEEQITSDLEEANRQLESGLISPAEFEEREAALIRRLEEIDARKRRGERRGAR